MPRPLDVRKFYKDGMYRFRIDVEAFDLFRVEKQVSKKLYRIKDNFFCTCNLILARQVLDCCGMYEAKKYAQALRTPGPLPPKMF